MWTAEAIRALRVSRGESQTEFADALGVARPTVSEWERGRVQVSAIGAAALDRLVQQPRDKSDDFAAGVRYACGQISEIIARLLSEQGASDAEAVRARALATLAAASAAPAPGDPPASATPATRRRRA